MTLYALANFLKSSKEGTISFMSVGLIFPLLKSWEENKYGRLFLGPSRRRNRRTRHDCLRGQTHGPAARAGDPSYLRPTVLACVCRPHRVLPGLGHSRTLAS